MKPKSTPAIDSTRPAALKVTSGIRAGRRATFTGGCVTEVKLDDLDANNNKKPYT